MALKYDDDFDEQLSGESQKHEHSSSWFKRMKKGISTSTSEKKEAPDGLWSKCPMQIYLYHGELKENLLFAQNELSYRLEVQNILISYLMINTRIIFRYHVNRLLGFNDLKP
jgi:hypothetical protein